MANTPAPAPFAPQAFTREVLIGTAAQWLTWGDRVLKAYETGRESDTGFEKTGDGSTTWASLLYNNPGGNNPPQISPNITIPVDAGTYDVYVIAPITGVVSASQFLSPDALATSNTNYITWSITNLGQAGAGTNPVLAATAANKTMTTGGSAIAATVPRTLTLNGTASNLAVTAGDVIRIRYTVTGTLANAVTNAQTQLTFARS